MITMIGRWSKGTYEAAEPKEKSFYANVRLNLGVLAAPGNAEEATWDCQSTKGGSDTVSSNANKKRQVAEAMGQMGSTTDLPGQKGSGIC